MKKIYEAQCLSLDVAVFQKVMVGFLESRGFHTEAEELEASRIKADFDKVLTGSEALSCFSAKSFEKKSGSYKETILVNSADGFHHHQHAWLDMCYSDGRPRGLNVHFSLRLSMTDSVAIQYSTSYKSYGDKESIIYESEDRMYVYKDRGSEVVVDLLKPTVDALVEFGRDKVAHLLAGKGTYDWLLQFSTSGSVSVEKVT